MLYAFIVFSYRVLFYLTTVNVRYTAMSFRMRLTIRTVSITAIMSVFFLLAFRTLHYPASQLSSPRAIGLTRASRTAAV
jgi:hypothetical protein